MNNVVVRSFYNFLKKYKDKILIVLVLNIFSIFCSLLIPYILGNVIHSLESKEVTAKLLLNNFLIVFILYVGWDISVGIKDVIFEKVNKSMENDIRSFCHEKILNSNMAMIQGKSEGEIINKLIRDTEKLEKAFSNLFTLAMSITRIIGLTIMLIVTNGILSIFILILFVIIIIIQKLCTKSLSQHYSKYKVSEERILNNLKSQISGFMTIKVLSLEKKAIEIFEENNNETLEYHIQTSKKVSIVKNINYFISSMFSISAIFMGGFLYLINKINIGEIFSMYTYSIQLACELRSVIDMDIILKDIFLSFNRVMDFANKFDYDINDFEPINEINNIEFKEVDFQYDNKEIFTNLSFDAKKGDVIGLRGKNGSGKTTITYILCGFYKPEGVFINNKASSSFSEKGIVKNISYVLQNTFLFPTTIMNNLTCFGSVEESKVYEVCKKVGIHDKILSFPDGYKTVVNDKNLNLSGGEKQLISLARALLKESDVLILDEINSAVDSSIEDNLFKNIEEFFKDKIVFIISHRENVFSMCNKIIDLSCNTF